MKIASRVPLQRWYLIFATWGVFWITILTSTSSVGAESIRHLGLIFEPDKINSRSWHIACTSNHRAPTCSVRSLISTPASAVTGGPCYRTVYKICRYLLYDIMVQRLMVDTQSRLCWQPRSTCSCKNKYEGNRNESVGPRTKNRLQETRLNALKQKVIRNVLSFSLY